MDLKSSDRKRDVENRAQHRPEDRKRRENISSPYKQMLPWRESVPGRTNGYSIAEILLVFGIIAGVLVGVWAMYVMLGDEVDAKAVVTEIQNAAASCN